MLVHLLRHMLTDCNDAGRLCGRRCDAPLNAHGQAMAAATAERLADEGYASIVTSPLLRATDTATPLALRTGVPLTLDPRLAEADLGAWDGAVIAELSHDARYQAYLADAESQPPPGGERPSAIYARARAVLDELEGDAPVLVVAHKTTLRVLIAGLLGLPLADFRRALPQPPGALTTLRKTRSGFAVGAIASIEHLPAALRRA